MTPGRALLAVLLPLMVLTATSCQPTEVPPTEVPTAVSTQAAQAAATMPDPTEVPLPSYEAVCWYGSVLSLPEGSEFDDYLMLEPAEAGELGVAAADEEISVALDELRDVEGPEGLINVSGKVTCEVMDVGGCRFDVEEIHSYGEGAETKLISIDGWEGTIVTPSGEEPVGEGELEYLFRLGGDHPVRYPITAADEQLVTALSGLADSGVPVRISGQLSCGTSDPYGSQIVATVVE